MPPTAFNWLLFLILASRLKI
ncbi:hypothetical protein CP02DC14_0615A, partial [Chlamydia psittaci 02DC14]